MTLTTFAQDTAVGAIHELPYHLAITPVLRTFGTMAAILVFQASSIRGRNQSAIDPESGSL